MIASGYSIDLYCDAPMHERHKHPWPAQFVDESSRVAWAMVREAGWKVRIAIDYAICPSCVKAGAKLPEPRAFKIGAVVSRSDDEDLKLGGDES